MRSPVKSHFALLILLDVRTCEHLIEDLAGFLLRSEQISTTIQAYRK